MNDEADFRFILANNAELENFEAPGEGKKNQLRVLLMAHFH
jgi:hypothetical protein